MMRRLLFLLGLTLVCGTAFAADLPTLHSFFQLAPKDQSVVLLAKLFGRVGGLFPVTVPIGLMGTLFTKFNEALLVLNTIIVGYAVFFGVISSAHEGEFLGKKFNSVWVPLRAVLGIATLIPTKSGYCILQIIVMWIVIQGVGAADVVWSTAVNYLANKQSAGQGQMIAAGYQSQKIALGMLKNQICLQTWAKSMNVSKAKAMHNYPPYAPAIEQQKKKVIFDYNQCIDGLCVNCGEISINNTKVADAISNNIELVMNKANSYVYKEKDGADTSLIGVVGHEIVNSFPKVKSKPSSKSANSIEQKTDAGWIYAGAYYKWIAEQSNEQARLENIKDLLTVTLASAREGTPYSPMYVQKVVNAFVVNGEGVNIVLGESIGILNTATGLSYGSLGNGLGVVFNALSDWIVIMFTEMVTDHTPTQIMEGRVIKSGKDPLSQIQVFGNRIIGVAELTWTILMGLILAMLVAYTAMSDLPGFFKELGAIASAALFIVIGFLILFMFILGIILVTGLMLSVYLPLVPYIVFFFGVIGWFMSVFESMLAAPLVALGIAHPEGHEVYGRAEPAIMLITNVFLRPTLMIFGFLGGIMLSYVALDLLNSTYAYTVFQSVHTPDGQSALVSAKSVGMGPMQLIFYLVIYVSLVMMIVNKCFSLIHIIPDAVLRWIGGQQQFGEYAKGEEEKMAGQAKGAGGQIGGAMKPGTSDKTMGGQAMGAIKKWGGASMGKFAKGAKMSKKQAKNMTDKDSK